MVSIPMASAASQAIFQSKVAPAVQGRVFAMRGVISRSMMPLAFILAGPLADRLAGPLLQANGALSQTLVGTLLGAGPGRGIGLIFVLAGLLLAVASGVALATPQIRNLERALPEAVPDAAGMEAPAGAAVAGAARSA
jgi:MFS transporter, DHA3 family, macrolide efflux protein